MKQLFVTLGATIALSSCGVFNTETETEVILQDTTTLEFDSTAVAQAPFNTDSIANVSDLLDSLANVEPKACCETKTDAAQ